MSEAFPAVFVSHGAPTLPLDAIAATRADVMDANGDQLDARQRLIRTLVDLDLIDLDG